MRVFVVLAALSVGVGVVLLASLPTQPPAPSAPTVPVVGPVRIPYCPNPVPGNVTAFFKDYSAVSATCLDGLSVPMAFYPDLNYQPWTGRSGWKGTVFSPGCQQDIQVVLMLDGGSAKGCYATLYVLYGSLGGGMTGAGVTGDVSCHPFPLTMRVRMTTVGRPPLGQFDVQCSIQ